MAYRPKIKRASPTRYERWDKQYLWHPFTQQSLWNKEHPLIIDSGKGAFLRDLHGRRYLDGVSSLWVNLHGHRNPVLDRAVRNQLKRIAHSTFLGLSHVPAIELARALAGVAPGKLSRTFYSDNGATAVEVALKMAFQYWIEKTGEVRPEFLALKGSYHGDTLGAVSVGSIGAFHSKFKPLLFKNNFVERPSCFRCPYNRTGARHETRLGERIRRVPKPGDFRKETGCLWQCLADADRTLKSRSKNIAAAIVEPVIQGASGMQVMAPGYLAGLERLCRKYGVLLIVDEVATGFGRTGTLFASEQEGVRPDLLCAAKALTGGYSPLAATLATESVFRAFWGPYRKFKTFFHGHSYTAHPLGAAVALASLRLLQSAKLLEKTRRKAHLMKNELQPFKDLPVVGSVRQAGLMAGVEIVRNTRTNEPFPASARIGAKICRRLLAKGIWLRPLGDVLVLMPPPVISDTDLRRLVRELKLAILYETKT